MFCNKHSNFSELGQGTSAGKAGVTLDRKASSGRKPRCNKHLGSHLIDAVRQCRVIRKAATRPSAAQDPRGHLHPPCKTNGQRLLRLSSTRPCTAASSAKARAAAPAVAPTEPPKSMHCHKYRLMSKAHKRFAGSKHPVHGRWKLRRQRMQNITCPKTFCLSKGLSLDTRLSACCRWSKGIHQDVARARVLASQSKQPVARSLPKKGGVFLVPFFWCLFFGG